jgi:predicted nucleic acid-binding protein
MIKLSFESYVKFDEFINSPEGKVESSKIVVKEIYGALKSKKKKLKAFTVELEEEDMEFSVNIAREDWGDALAECLKHFEAQELSDECIDTYMVIQEFNELK